MKKTTKILAVVLSVIMVVSLFTISASAAEKKLSDYISDITSAISSGKTVTDYSVTGISNLEQLEDFADQVAGGNKYIGNPMTYKGKTVKLLADIGQVDSNGDPVYSRALTKSIGWGIAYISSFFEGTFDGCGHTVVLNISTALYGGLFRNNEGTIKNVTVAGKIKTLNSGFAGGIAGNNLGTIVNCCNKATIEVTDKSYGGGIVGTNDGTVANCFSYGKIVCTDDLSYGGGLVGSNLLGTITNSFYDSDVFAGNGVFAPNLSESKNGFTGLSTAECKAANGVVLWLNAYVGQNTDKGLYDWVVKTAGQTYPTFGKAVTPPVTPETPKSPKTGYDTVALALAMLMTLSLAVLTFNTVKSK